MTHKHTDSDENYVPRTCDRCGMPSEFTTVDQATDDDVCEDCILDNECSQCCASLDDGEGYDGLCGNCADKAEEDGKYDND